MSRPDPRGTRIVAWDPQDLRDHMRSAMTIYAEAMDYPLDVVDNRSGHAAEHTHRTGFRARVALAEPDRLVGFCYGYTVEPGQWWHDQVQRALTEDLARDWLPGALELCELHVAPDRQGNGLGRALLLDLLGGASQPAVVLSTPEGESRAWRLYRSLGFADLARRYAFPGDGRPFAVLGARLPLRPPDA
ncbi:GNAT family N-acetyltransferase [soil metagenome]